jgi:hypothetical protein
VAYANSHILGKLCNLPKDFLGGSSTDVTKAEFLVFIKKAVNRKSPEYIELYFFLLKTFQSGDVARKGQVDAMAFDRMIEAAADAPRRFGLAPKSSDMFSTDYVSFTYIFVLTVAYIVRNRSELRRGYPPFTKK